MNSGARVSVVMWVNWSSFADRLFEKEWRDVE